MNEYNYVRVSRLEPISIESLALVIVLGYVLYMAYRKQMNWDIAYFLALPFTDDPFRIASLQPVELLSVLLIVFNYRRIRLNYVILIGLSFLLFSFVGIALGNVHGTYSPLYSLRFLLIGLVFSVFRNKPFGLSISTLRFIVLLSFSMTFLQAALWLAGLPIHGVFYNGVLPRTKGLAHEPATWSIWVVTLFPFILHFKLGRLYLILNFIMLLLTFSTFGTIAAAGFFGIRWLLSGARFRLNRSFVRGMGLTLALALVLVTVKPDSVSSAAKLLTIFDKLVLYQQEVVRISQGGGIQSMNEDGAISGRSSDFVYFRENFPEHWFVGIGSFNAPYDVTGPNPIAGTNTYVILPVELGIVGTSLIFFLLFLHYRGLLLDYPRRSTDFLAYSLDFLLMIGGIRCFGFYEPWFTQAALLRLAPSEEKVEDMPASSIEKDITKVLAGA